MGPGWDQRRGRASGRRAGARPRARASEHHLAPSPSAKSSSLTPAGMATTRAGGHAGGDHELADGLPARDDAVGQPRVHRIEAARGSGMDTCRVRSTGTPVDRAASPPSQPSTELCVCTTSTCSPRISATRPRDGGEVPRRRASAAPPPRARAPARGARSRPSGWAGDDHAPPPLADPARLVERADLLPAEPGRGLGMEDRLHADGDAPHADARRPSAVDGAHAGMLDGTLREKARRARGAPEPTTRARRRSRRAEPRVGGAEERDGGDAERGGQVRDAGVRAHEALTAASGDAAAAPAGRGPPATRAPAAASRRTAAAAATSPGPPSSTGASRS